MSELYGFDAYSPREIAARVESVGVAKARFPLLSQIMLGILAGAFIGLGSLYFTLVTSDSTLSFAAARVLGGLVFSLGLLLVIVAGAELFTGNNLLAMAWAEGKLTSTDVLRNWVIVCLANFVGAAGLALLVFLSGHLGMNGGAVAIGHPIGASGARVLTTLVHALGQRGKKAIRSPSNDGTIDAVGKRSFGICE